MVLFFNVAGLAAACCLMFGHFLISRERLEEGYLWSLSGAALMAFASLFLGSWPVFALNIAWGSISLIGWIRMGLFAKASKPSPQKHEAASNRLVLRILLGLVILALPLAWVGNERGQDAAAWLSISITLVSFALLSLGKLSNRAYLAVSAVATLALIPHLLTHQNYGALTNETIALLVSSHPFIVAARRLAIGQAVRVGLSAVMAPGATASAGRALGDRIEPTIDTLAEI